MLFNSFEFLLFFILFIAGYQWLRSNLRAQNFYLFVGSYIFYGWWNWKFLFLILISSLTDFYIGKYLYRTQEQRKRKILLVCSMSVNLGILGFFKYFNFFSESFAELFTAIGFRVDPYYLAIILPVGISFYTFQTMSYTIDIYKGKLKASDNLINFMAFVSFFPQLVAGPIERASNLLPQFSKQRKTTVQDWQEGLNQIFWGLFKKIVIADNCAIYVNQIFEAPDQYPGSVLFIGAILFAFQIYGDFSGYSDMAIGIAKLMGFNLMQNFKSPYLAQNIQDFWRRWHISLSTWFRDYLYIPLGGSQVEGRFKKYLNIFITFTVSGFWHGANWTFLVWGMLHGVYYMIQDTYVRLCNGSRWAIFSGKWVAIGLTFFSTVLAWIFFRAESVSEAVNIIGNILNVSLLASPISYLKLMAPPTSLLMIVIALGYLGFFELLHTNALYSFQTAKMKRAARILAFASLILIILLFRATNGALDFIYFQF
ncbi:MAG: hypothetical protein RLZZ241_2577 [Bacteroidota bacterium]|jgi:D-alanyl-lipoteichoic acid acyltransferase DltB (MBOAT superfamily)